MAMVQFLPRANSNECSDKEEMVEHQNVAYARLRNGKKLVRIHDSFFRCPFCVNQNSLSTGSLIWCHMLLARGNEGVGAWRRLDNKGPWLCSRRLMGNLFCHLPLLELVLWSNRLLYALKAKTLWDNCRPLGIYCITFKRGMAGFDDCMEYDPAFLKQGRERYSWYQSQKGGLKI